MFIALGDLDLQEYSQEKNMNVAIIGCGCLGNKIARHLSYAFGCTVTAIALNKEEVPQIKIASSQQAAIVTTGDEASLYSVLDNQDAVILSFPVIRSALQLDAFGDYHTSSDEETYLYTAKNLVKILELKLRNIPTVKQLILLSSCAVYGNTDGQWVNEDSPIAPSNKQIEIISQIENILLQPSSDLLRVCILRLGGIYGLGRELKDYSSLCDQTLPGTGEEFINWTHIDDIRSVTGFILQNKLQGIYNLVNDLPMKSGDFLDRVCKSEGFASVEWDSSININRPNVRVSNQKLKSVGYRFIRTEVSI